jgi:hypothetical protein
VGDVNLSDEEEDLSGKPIQLSTDELHVTYKNLPFKAREEQIISEFARLNIKYKHLEWRKDNEGKIRDATLYFNTEEEAKTALNMNGSKLLGKELQIDYEKSTKFKEAPSIPVKPIPAIENQLPKPISEIKNPEAEVKKDTYTQKVIEPVQQAGQSAEPKANPINKPEAPKIPEGVTNVYTQLSAAEQQKMIMMGGGEPKKSAAPKKERESS